LGTGTEYAQSVDLLPSGSLIVAGSFASHNGVPVGKGLVKLNSNGAIDASFKGLKEGFNLPVTLAKALPNGQILAVGAFTAVNSSSAKSNIATIDGTHKNVSFGLGPEWPYTGTVVSIQKNSAGKIMIGGSFPNQSTFPNNFVRLNSDGSLDTSMSGNTSGFNSTVSSFVEQSNGQIVFGGNFNQYNAVGTAGGIVRTSNSGVVDATFNGATSGFFGLVVDLQVQTDGKYLAGGFFTLYNGSMAISRNFLRLNSNGSRDTTFNNGGTGFNNPVGTSAIQSDSKILVGGDFSTYNGTSIPRGFARLNANGTLDTLSGMSTGFDARASINKIQILDSGQFLLGGLFVTFNGSSEAPSGLIQLNTDGSLDPSFNPANGRFNGEVQDFIVRSDGTIGVAGNFAADCGPKGLWYNFVVLNADGSCN
jgi:uncharacterized delta-60 repeat protein